MFYHKLQYYRSFWAPLFPLRAVVELIKSVHCSLTKPENETNLSLEARWLGLETLEERHVHWNQLTQWKLKEHICKY